jgi:hypothetical protein
MQLFRLLIVSDVGLFESDIVTLLDRYVKLTSEDESNEINAMVWSRMRRQLKVFLDTTWVEARQLLVLRHATIHKVVTRSNEHHPLHWSFSN